MSVQEFRISRDFKRATVEELKTSRLLHSLVLQEFKFNACANSKLLKKIFSVILIWCRFK
jgi:hypothetical protein